MGQKLEHSKGKRSPKLYGYQILASEEGEEEKENREKENKDLEKINKLFEEIIGMADSRNGTLVVFDLCFIYLSDFYLYMLLLSKRTLLACCIAKYNVKQAP